MINRKLYSNLAEERLQTAENFKDGDVVKGITAIKDLYWFGSANAWAVFVGISPGKSSPKGKEDEANYKSQISFNEVSRHLTEFNDTSGFWKKIREYTKELFPDISEKDLYKTILTGNLINPQEGNSKKLSKTDDDKKRLLEGAVESLKVLSLVKPKLVICLQKDVYELLYRVAEEKGNEEIAGKTIQIDSGLKNNITYKVPVTFLQSKDELWGKWVITRVPMHPSRANFCDATNFKEQFLEKIRLCVKDYLDNKIDIVDEKI